MPLPAVLRRFLPQFLMATAAKSQPPDLLQKILVVQIGSTLVYNALPNPDESLRLYAPQEGIKYYSRVRRQLGAVSGIAKLRVDASMALPHNWVPGDVNDQESIDWCEGVKQAWNFQGRDIGMRRMMFCILDGLSIGELLYDTVDVAIKVKASRDNPNPANVGKVDRVETWVVPVALIDLPVDKFFIDRDFQLRIRPLGSNPVGEVVDPMKVLVGRYGSNQPYGIGEMKDIVTDSWKLDWIDREGLKALERSGYPLAQVTVPEGWDEDRIRSTMAWANQTYKNYMIVRLGDRFGITFPDETVRPTFIGAEQVARIKQIQDDISIGMLGVSFSNSSTGGKARDQVRNEMRFEKTSVDSAVYDDIANQWEAKVRLLNRPSMATYKRATMTTDYMPTQDVVARSNVFVQAVGMGYPASIQQYSEEFGLRTAISETDTLKKAALPQGQTGPQTGAMGRNMGDPSQNDQPFSSINPNDGKTAVMREDVEYVSVPTESGVVLRIPKDDYVDTVNRGLVHRSELVSGDELKTLRDHPTN